VNGYAPPSALLRAALSLVLLLGFYVVVLGVAAVLFAIPVGYLFVLFHAGRFELRVLVLAAFCWIPAGLLLTSLFSTQRPPLVLPKRRLERAEAPALFALIDDLAARAKTSAPTEVYLDPFPNLAVTEAGSVFRSRRILIVGAPMVSMLTVDELCAVIAHELGHFIGGDTRLTTFAVQTHALFASVFVAVDRNPFHVGTQHYAIEGGFAIAEAIGQALVNAYARVFLVLTRPLERRQELAADALSASLVGRGATMRALDKTAIQGALYMRYLDADVGFAVTRGAMPSDLTEGFASLRASFLETDAGRVFAEKVRTRPTRAFDSHPALAERLRAVALQTESAHKEDSRPATGLFADPAALEGWLTEATREQVIAAAVKSGLTVPTLQSLSWSEIPAVAYTPFAWEAARRASERLYALFPHATTIGAMFVATWEGLEAGRLPELAIRLDPSLGQLHPMEAEPLAKRLALEVLTALMQGALLERGASAEASLGERSLVFRWGEERICPSELMIDLTTGSDESRATLGRWAARLAQDRSAL
jgi:Zn-dependent protease with chaperone function